MSPLLTGHIEQYRIDLRHRLRRGFGPEHLGAGRGEPLADQLAVEPIMVHDQYALHEGAAR